MNLPRPQSLSKGEEENEKKFFAHQALPGNDITATDLYRLQLHCTVPNEGPAEEADFELFPASGKTLAERLRVLAASCEELRARTGNPP